MNEKLIVILNPKSGSAGEDFRARVEAALQEHGATFEIRETTPEISGGALAETAANEGASQILACGGDGTIMSVINGLGKKLGDGVHDDAAQLPMLSIVPGGTANLLAGSLGIPTDLDEAIGVALAGEERVLDLGRCGDKLFALGLGLGLTEKLVSQASAQAKERWGKLAYAWAMLRELGAKPHTFSYKLDDKPVRTRRGVAIVIANAGKIGGPFRFAPNARMDDGLLDLCILHRFYLRDLLRLAGRAIFRSLPEDRAVSFYQAKRIEIRSNPPLDTQIDGEEVDVHPPLLAVALPQVLRVRGPIRQTERDDE